MYSIPRNRNGYVLLPEENQGWKISPNALKELVNRCHRALDYICDIRVGASLESSYTRMNLVTKLEVLFVQIESIHVKSSPSISSQSKNAISFIFIFLDVVFKQYRYGSL